MPGGIVAPRVSVTIETPNGEYVEYDVQTDNRDMVQYDFVRSRRDWPKGGDAPVLWSTFLAWHAMKRCGDTSMDFDAFNGACVSVRPTDHDGNTVEDIEANEDELMVFPTQAEAVPGSVSALPL